MNNEFKYHHFFFPKPRCRLASFSTYINSLASCEVTFDAENADNNRMTSLRYRDVKTTGSKQGSCGAVISKDLA